MTESHISPSRRSLRGPWIAAIFLAGAAVAVGAVLLISNLVAPKTPTAAPVASVAATTTAAGDAVMPTPFTASPSQVDMLIANDGHPLLLNAGLGHYDDAYALINDVCDSMGSETTDPKQWLAAHLLNASVPGEAAALRIGIPLVCPQYNSALLAVEGG